MKKIKGFLMMAAAAATLLAGVVFNAEIARAAVFSYIDENGETQSTEDNVTELSTDNNDTNPEWGVDGMRLLLTYLIQTE